MFFIIYYNIIVFFRSQKQRKAACRKERRKRKRQALAKARECGTSSTSCCNKEFCIFSICQILSYDIWSVAGLSNGDICTQEEDDLSGQDEDAYELERYRCCYKPISFN